ncbi:MAG: 2Fe-2S iron-sulfur cluster-binding protein [Firmicutes bacterium]|nr:2Fe-2S iron-sulfur cluster-binding protein [Bacillota bacterium]
MTDRITLVIDGKTVSAVAGEMLLWVALDNDIYIPHLCGSRDDQEKPASCRLCFVEVDGRPLPVTACTLPVSEGLVVRTGGERVDALVATGFELLMSNHRLDCKNCPANGDCALQQIAKTRKLKLKPKKLPVLERDLTVDDSVPGILFDPNKCVLCGHCIKACLRDGNGILGFTRRGFERVISTFGDLPLAESECSGCGSCAAVCPVGAWSAHLHAEAF